MTNTVNDPTTTYFSKVLHTEKPYDNSPWYSNTTDVIYQDFQLYIEGVQTPFVNITISQAMGNIPSASISVPPSPGLMDIAKYYQPKVHIFYTDTITGGQRLLFWGHIVATNYKMSSNSTNITFNCIHKNNLLNEVTVDFKGYAQEGTNQSNPNADNSMYKATDFGSSHSLLLALEGITGVSPTPTADNLTTQISPANRANVLDADRTLLDYSLKDLEGRFIGMPAAMMNMWNQMKITTYYAEEFNTILSKVYIPLTENGIAFFKRTSGHPYVDRMIQSSKIDACTVCEGKYYGKQMVPPAFKLNTISSIQSSLSTEVVRAAAGFSGENTGFLRMFNEFFYSIDYEVITLASPASVPADPLKTGKGGNMMAIETIIKPQMPFYFSPICNVILPYMYNDIELSQGDHDIATRVDVIYEPLQGDGNLNLTYRGPPSIRESINKGIFISITADDNAKKDLSLTLTKSFSYNIPGKYELGMGFRPKRIAMPNWLAHMAVDNKQKSSEEQTEQLPPLGTVADQIIKDLHSAWIDRYGYSVDSDGNRKRDTSKDTLNPFGKSAQIHAFERLLFSHADYDFTKNILSSRTGNLSGIFNPYIVPGYPMDIVAKTPNHPSFHAVCASVTHSITSNSVATSISFMAASTYSELSNYHLLPVHPWLQTALDIINVERSGTEPDPDNKDVNLTPEQPTTGTSSDSSVDKPTPEATFIGNTGKVTAVHSTLVNNPKAKESADLFYMSVLGVGATSPSDLVEFSTMEVSAQYRGEDGIMTPNGVSDSIPLANGGEGNPNLTAAGNLKLIHRLIESRDNIEEKFGNTFIDLNTVNYNPSFVAYKDSQLTDSTKLEPGASLFLNYPEIDSFLIENGFTTTTPSLDTNTK